ncbi:MULTISPECIES: hypothetical protein [unclassified Wolbachia]|uniref:hypothetical protein n=1 Tax=unclassified Wolbachia TaxID=2640676 RepID=UPI0021F83230|nr:MULTISPECIES: hypothetical protein [unclassified Wolbachia]
MNLLREQFEEIYKKLQEILTLGIKDPKEINDKIEQGLEQDIKSTPEFEAWKQNSFSLDYVFKVGKEHKTETAFLIHACQKSNAKEVELLLGKGASVKVEVERTGKENPFSIIIDKLSDKGVDQEKKSEEKQILGLLLQKLKPLVDAKEDIVNSIIREC